MCATISQCIYKQNSKHVIRYVEHHYNTTEAYVCAYSLVMEQLHYSLTSLLEDNPVLWPMGIKVSIVKM